MKQMSIGGGTMDKCSDDDLLRLGKKVHDTFSNDRNHVSVYGLGWADGKVKDLNYVWCHAGLMYDENRNRKKPLLVIANQVQTEYSSGWVGKGVLEAYYSFLFHESVFAECYVTKDPSRCIEDGVIVRTDRPANLVVAACIATRQAWEKKSIGMTVVGLIKLGLSPRKAHLAAHSIALAEDGSWVSKCFVGHVAVLVGYMDKRSVSNFLSGYLNKTEELNVKTYEEARTYSGIPYMWGQKPRGTGLGIRQQGEFSKARTDYDPFGLIKTVGTLPKKKLSVVKAVEEAIERILK